MTSLPKIIQRKLRTFEKTLRTYVLIDGLATTIFGIILLLAVDFALDRFFEFSQGFRFFLFFVLIAAIGAIVWFRILRRILSRFKNDQIAMVFEHYIPQLNESLITSVQNTEKQGQTAKRNVETIDPVLMDQTVRQAAESLQNVEIKRFFRYGRLTFRILAASLLVGVAAGVCNAFSETSELWFSRNVLLSNRDWPRRSKLIVEDFKDGRIRIGRGDSFTLSVKADARMPLVPDAIRLRLGSNDSGYRTLILDQFQTDSKDAGNWRIFSYTFNELLETLAIQIRGADSTIGGLAIEVVPQPILTDIRLTQRFPDYMNRPERTIPATGRLSIPDGTSVTISARSNKPLIEVRTLAQREKEVFFRREVIEDAFETVDVNLEELREDTQIEFLLEDIDQLRNRQPIRLDLSVIKDQLPIITARLDGIGSVVTPNALLPTLGEISDDYGLDKIRYRYHIERNVSKDTDSKNMDEDKSESTEVVIQVEPEKQEGTLVIEGLGKEQTQFALDSSFPLSLLNLHPGDKLTVGIEATDRFNLDKEPNERIGLGPQWPLEIVTPERLRSLLEVREISLRQRFEVLIGEVERTRSLIEEIDLKPTEEQIKQADQLTLNGEPLSDDEQEQRQAELETKKKIILETITSEQSAAGQYNVSRSLRDTQKEVYDLKALIESFRLIRREMVNNQIFSDDVQQRIDRGIIDPMQNLVDLDFPETDRLTDLLGTTLTQQGKTLRPQAQNEQKTILDQFDLLVKKMQSIRDSMVTMESFNEVIEILRSIIKQQQQIRNETQEQKNQRLRNLLEL